ncbi:MAG: hypothetical protein FJY97_04920 [candidate division Zixibacteria bacterium]|nr:hypothetical protein [candidate division Zixibacteria bacterium]
MPLDTFSSASLSRLTILGSADILHLPLVGLLCSVRCTGQAILRMYRLALALRDAGIPAIGGFHTPMEQECLQVLLSGRQPVAICPARSIEKMRVPTAWRQPLLEGRLALVSSFDTGNGRISARLAERRNRLVAELAQNVVVGYASPGSRTEALCLEMVKQGKRVYTLDLPENGALQTSGVMAYDVNELITAVK